MQKPLKTILFWTKFFDSEDFYFGLGMQPFSHCPVNSCQTTANQTLISESDAVIFHIPNLDLSTLPESRSSHQRWIFFTLECPEYTLVSNDSIREVNGMFNWTMTYRYLNSVLFNRFLYSLFKFYL